jgi:hypothetical protein
MKLKKILAVLTAFLILPALPLNNTQTKIVAAADLRADVNGDSAVTAKDLAAYKRLALSGEKLDDVEDNFDINSSQTFTKTDLKIMQKVVSGEASLIAKKGLLINEISPSNDSVIADENGVYNDFVELFNNTDKTIDLSGYSLSDNPKKPTKYTFPAGSSIAAGEYKIINASDELTGFAFSKNGEDCVLSDPNGKVIDQISFVAGDEDLSFARFSNGSDIWKWVTATPGASNDTAEIVNNYAAAPLPEFSDETGFYGSAFDLTLTPADGTTVYYTTDTEEPDVDSLVYTTPISIIDRKNEQTGLFQTTELVYGDAEYIPTGENVPKGTVVRTFSFDKEDGNISDSVAKTYFVGLDQADYNNVPVISIVGNPGDFFDYEDGIFVLGKSFDDYYKNHYIPVGQDWTIVGNYSQRGKEWEREIQFDFIEGDNVFGFSENLGVRVMGNASRTYSQKSMKLYARSDYGAKNVKYDLLPDLVASGDGTTQIEKFNTFILRNGANDADFAKLRDPFIQELVEDRSFDTQDSRPVVVFLNGEYWGLYSLIQDYDDKYVENHYGVPEDEVIVIENESVDNGEKEDLQLYKNLTNFAKNNDLSVAANYAQISEMMDIQNFAEYMCAEIFISNADWVNNYNNQRYWRSRTIDPTNKWMDGKWRWMMYDTEYSLGLYGNPDTSYTNDSLRIALQYSPLLNSLCKNAEFKQYFADTMEDMLANEFSVENSTNLLNQMRNEYEPLILDNIMRWGPQWIMDDEAKKGIPLMNTFETNLDTIEEFLRNRKATIVTSFKNNLNVTIS